MLDCRISALNPVRSLTRVLAAILALGLALALALALAVVLLAKFLDTKEIPVIYL
jgi:uncharacterized protein involved in exopolysaccharide biosynthesis